MLKEQHLRKVEAALSEAIQSARIAGLDEKELIDTLRTLIRLEDEQDGE